ncbi:helix-turn-helix domain-containing protein [Actinophytocola gossypii]|uniref:Helix-turn-helix domain-containing protein n=1 Tax=Actinophytocola gossypii TaxID=2812003 RepID=A0ABT2JAM5_9PSEU|nr:helix-turn-helix domain-containing protein [Actinophytocola gossypii]MCT2584902.1 helix-turn-helix domain-containing protein [Actinophytocola gossypii]
MLTVRVGPERLAGSRFALSRLAELSCALEVLTHPARAPFAARWVASTRPRVDRDAVSLVHALVEPESAYVPDFLVPLPAEYEPTLDAELEAVATTPPGTVRDHLERAFPGSPLPPAVAAVLDRGGERAVAESAAEQLRHCWHATLADSWPALRRVLDEDVRHRAANAARVGLARILGDLHPTLRWDGAVLTKESAYDLVAEPVPGPVLTPSVFLPWPAVWNGAPGDVLLGYPARGRGAVWASPGRVLGAPKLSARRVALLADLDTPRSTSELATRHHLSPATVSYHLTRLDADGLVTRRQDGHSVLYTATDGARTLLTAMTHAARH